MHFFNDQLRHVTRRLVAAPLFTVVALLTLAIGIGALALSSRRARGGDPARARAARGGRSPLLRRRPPGTA